ncbi:MAG: ribulose-phosphate 3-epimerase [Smithellaceae bacterium]|nr:ribulose-phosphate 3-epimerase [Smithellaceae bacterium]
MQKIAPSILSADASRLGEEIAGVEKAGADMIHIDVMDGHFVPNLTIGPAVTKSLRRITNLPFDVHLMIEKPEQFIDDFAAAGSNIITVHLEAASHLHRAVQQIKRRGIMAGVSLNPATSLSLVEQILPDLDLLLIMTVNPGFGGQLFIESLLPKIAAARRLIDAKAPNILLEVDGGVTSQNIGKIAAAGADVMVAGQAIFGAGDYRQAISGLKAELTKSKEGS